MKLKIIFNDIKNVVINNILITFFVRLSWTLDDVLQVIVYWRHRLSSFRQAFSSRVMPVFSPSPLTSRNQGEPAYVRSQRASTAHLRYSTEFKSIFLHPHISKIIHIYHSFFFIGISITISCKSYILWAP